MELNINQHLLDTIHFRPLIKESFKESGPDGLLYSNLDYSEVDDDLSLTDKLNLENHYKTLKSKKNSDSNLKDEIDQKLKDMINERKSFKRNYNLSDKESFDNKKFMDSFLQFMERSRRSLVVLKLDDVTYKFIPNNSFSKTFADVYNLYKIMFPDMKIDLSKSKFIFSINKDENSYEESNWNKFMDLTTKYSYNFDGETNETDFNNAQNFDVALLEKLNKFYLIDAKTFKNIDSIVEKNREIFEMTKQLNKLINEHNELSMYKLTNVQLDTLQEMKEEIRQVDYANINELFLEEQFKSDSNKVPVLVVKSSVKPQFNPSYLMPLKVEENILEKRKKELYDLRPMPISDRQNSLNYNETQQFIREDTKNYVLYNKYFGRLVLVEYLNTFLLDELKEFEIVRPLTNFEYKQLIKYYSEQIDSFDESDKVDDMKEFINRCLSEIDSREKEDKILIFIKDYFRFTQSLEDKMKFTEISKVVNNNFVEKVSNVQLADYLKKLGLAKKRYNDGIYWYGLVDRKEEVKKQVQKKYSELLVEEQKKEQVKNKYNELLKEDEQTKQVNNIYSDLIGQLVEEEKKKPILKNVLDELKK